MEFFQNRVFSHGKLLLTGEYMVLCGARALAFPTCYGQDLVIEENEANENLYWNAYNKNEFWFSATYRLPDFSIRDSSNKEKAQFLKNILLKASELGDREFNPNKGYSITTRTNFPVEWGLGTSSTLINNLAQITGANPYKLLHSVSSGSGYDIACAMNKKPIIYSLNSLNEPQVETITFNKNFLNSMFFVYSGRKMATQNNIEEFKKIDRSWSSEIGEINKITVELINTDNLNEFAELLRKHETIISTVLGKPTVQQENFNNFNGVIKSLGAWGGDFLLATTLIGEDYVRRYFEQFGLSTIIPFNKMILH